jgi:scyllo-inositol 2-dehydrogenase (NAD+)
VAKLNIGLIGVGRLGRVYARDLSTRIACTRLTAIADTDPRALERARDEFGVAHAFLDSDELVRDRSVDAVVIVTPTSTHREVALAATAVRKPIFCEKPPSISLDDALAMRESVAQSGVFFQLGFMRRFDSGYAAAKARVDDGAIGDPVVFKSTSRDPYPPSLSYADPRTSGGLIIDMGIHDFDLARWYMGEVASVQAIGGVLAYPDFATIADIDNAVVSLVFATGRLGVVDLTRNGIYGYDISTELLGTQGTLRIGYLRETPLTVLTRTGVSHDTVPYFMERFRDAYTAQLENFARNVLDGKEPPVTIEDGLQALRVAVAATQARETGLPVLIASPSSENRNQQNVEPRRTRTRT